MNNFPYTFVQITKIKIKANLFVLSIYLLIFLHIFLHSNVYYISMK